MSGFNELTTFANREVQNLIFVDYQTNKEFLYCDFANATATDVTGDVTFAYGGWGRPQRVAFNGAKTGTLKIETQMQSAKLYSLITGSDIDKTTEWLKREELTANSEGQLTLSGTPLANTVNVYAIDDDCGTRIEGEVSGKNITGTGITADKTYVVYYQMTLNNVQSLKVKSTVFPKAFKIYGDTWSRTDKEVIISQKMIAYKAQPQTSFSISNSNSGEPATVTLTFDLLVDKNHNQLELIFEDEAA